MVRCVSLEYVNIMGDNPSGRRHNTTSTNMHHLVPARRLPRVTLTHLQHSRLLRRPEVRGESREEDDPHQQGESRSEILIKSPQSLL